MDAPEPKGEASDRSAATIARPDEPPSVEEVPVEVAPADALAWLATQSGSGPVEKSDAAPAKAPLPDAMSWLASRSVTAPQTTPIAEVTPIAETPPPAPAEAEPESEAVDPADAVAWLESHSGEGTIEPDEPETATATATVSRSDPASAVAPCDEASALEEGAALFCRIAERAGVLSTEQAGVLLAAWRSQPSQGTDALARATLTLGLLTPAQVESVLRLAGLTPQVATTGEALPAGILPDGPEFALLVRLKRLASDGDLAGSAALQTQLAGTVFARLGDVIVRKAALARGAPPPSPSPPSTPRPPVPSQPPRPARPTPTPVRAARRQAFDLYVRLKQAVARGDTAEAGALREQLRGDPEFDRLAEGLVRKVWGRQALVSARTTGATLLPCPGCKTPAPADAPCPRCGAAPASAPAPGSASASVPAAPASDLRPPLPTPAPDVCPPTPEGP